LAKLDPLRVDLVMPSSRYGSVALHDQISVQPDLPGAAPVMARVTRIDKVIDVASNTFRVRLNLPNPGHRLPAGARCRVELPPVEAPALPLQSPAAMPSNAVRPMIPRKVAG
jgi:multidrug efflux pump subunit AcrA (membrane-fusion protein)